jgi:hypothetical protein
VLTASAGAVRSANAAQVFAGVQLRDTLTDANTNLSSFDTTVKALNQSNRTNIDTLIEGARLNTLNAKEVEMLTGVQASLRAELETGNLSLAKRNEITNQLNKTTEALNASQTVATSGFRALAQQGVQQFGQFFAQLSPIGLAMEFLGEVLKTLQPVIDALKEPFKAMAAIVGRALIPILKAFWPTIRGLAIAISYVAEVVFRVAGGLASAVGGAIAAIGSVISKIPFLGKVGRAIQERGESIQEIGRGFTQAGKEMGNLRDELRNMNFGEDAEDTTTALLSESNDIQARTAVNTDRIATAMEDQMQRPPSNITVNISGGGGGDPQELAARVAEEIDRVLGRTTSRDTRLNGAMAF